MKPEPKSLVAWLVAAVSWLHTTPAHAAPSRTALVPNAEQAIRRTYQQREVALKRHDGGGVLATYSPAFRGVGVSGRRLDYTGIKALIARGAAAGSKGYAYHTTWQPQSCSVEGNKATILMRFIKRETAAPSPRHGLYYATEEGLARDEWVLTDGRWQQTSSSGTFNRTTFSLKPIAAP